MTGLKCQTLEFLESITISSIFV